jgi:protein TonB
VFESFIERKKKPFSSRLPALVLSVILHGGALVLILFLSLLYVKELPEPQVTVTFFAAAPPPPPPPPPPPLMPEKAVVRPKVVQPPDRPMPAPMEEQVVGHEEGVEGGVEDGVPGGLPDQPVFVGPKVGEKLKLSGALPVYLEAAKRKGVQGVVIVKLCITADGWVDAERTKILKGIPVLDAEVLSKVITWRYRPYTAEGLPTPACFPVRFVFRLI